MNKLLMLVAVIALSLSAFAKPAKVDIKTNITCGGCATTIKSAMKDVKGVEKTSVDVASKVVTVNYDDAVINTENLSKLIVDAGYSAELVDGGKAISAEPKQCATEKKCGDDKNCCKDKKGSKKG
ncbi:cation transporter [Candidatus Kapabacteria bacterium]|nr:cation transporter [Candidatus Kapabacteria bacterium]